MMARLTAILLLTGAFVGCIGDGTGEPLDETAAPGLPADLERVPFSFDGTLAHGLQPSTHALDVPDDVAFIEVSFDVTSAPVGGATMDLIGPDGTTVVSVGAGDTATVPRLPLEAAGPGTYTVEVWGGLLSTQVSYTVEGTLATGEVAAPVVPAPAEPTGIHNDGVVVAVVDTGINVYHEAFRAEDPRDIAPVDAVSGEAVRTVPLTFTDELDEGLVADDATWRGLERGVLYRFEGTRVLGISMADDDLPWERYPVLDESGHGTATAGTVLSVAPEATVVMVEVSATSWGEIARAIDWAAEQPWIDVISVSMGNTGNLPNPLIAGGDPDNAVPKASRKAVDNGKVYVNSAGNDPTFHYTDNPDGPPWTIAVSGAEPSMKGRDLIPANGPDYVANFSVFAPLEDSVTEHGWTQGTSFSAPTAAGAFARAIHTVRAASGHAGGITEEGLLVDAGGIRVDNLALREAFNRTAAYWDTTEYDPTSPPGDSPFTQLLATSAPVLPTPYVQMGWGYVGHAEADAAAAHLVGETDAPEKGPDAVAFMEAQQELRRAYWAQEMG